MDKTPQMPGAPELPTTAESPKPEKLKIPTPGETKNSEETKGKNKGEGKSKKKPGTRKRGASKPRTPQLKDWIRIKNSGGNSMPNEILKLIINTKTGIAKIVTNAKLKKNSNDMEGERTQIFKFTEFEVTDEPAPPTEAPAEAPAEVPTE